MDRYIRRLLLSLLLLPYCAKLVGCSYRHDKDCVECGACSVSEPYRWAREMGRGISSVVSVQA